jgi:hypothetical protein
MRHLNLITLVAFGLLLFHGASNSESIPQDTSHSIIVPATKSSEAASESLVTTTTATMKDDSSHQKSILDSFFFLEKTRKQIFIFDSTREFGTPYSIGSSELYRKDATSIAEGVKYHPLMTVVKFGLSNSLNQYLPYGTVAPVSAVWTNDIFSQRMPFNLFPINQVHQFSTKTEAISIENSGIYLLDFPAKAVLPEAVLLWETGAFGETILDVRISRPLSRNIMISIFSNYRHFNGMNYTHDANDIYRFYSNFYKDSSLSSGKGYNPQVDEHVSGLQIKYTGKNNNALHLEFQYGDMLNEIAINKVTSVNLQMFEMLHRYPISLSLLSTANTFKRLFWDFGFTYLNEPVVKLQPAFANNNTGPVRGDGTYNDLSLSLQSGTAVRKTDSTGIRLSSTWAKVYRFDRSDWQNKILDSRLFYNFYTHRNDLQFKANFNGGIEIESTGDSTGLSPVWHAGFDIYNKSQHLRLYLKQDNIPYSLPFDTLNTVIPPLFDNYMSGGLEYLLHSEKGQILLGYQYLSTINKISVNNAWPSGIPPYNQPHSTFIIAPASGRWNGLALSGSGNFSDKKPFIKTTSRLSYIFHPLSTSEFIDINAGFEYWSERDPISFAGRTDWNKAFYNVDLEIAAHIMSFRLFYKVDNILNRKFAYVPGYYSSGLTFRWGFNWFIQR